MPEYDGESVMMADVPSVQMECPLECGGLIEEKNDPGGQIHYETCPNKKIECNICMRNIKSKNKENHINNHIKIFQNVTKELAK